MKWHFKLKCLRSLKRSVCGQAEGSFVLTVSRSMGAARWRARPGGGARIPELFDIFLHKAEIGPMIASMTNSSTEPAWPPVPGAPGTTNGRRANAVGTEI